MSYRIILSSNATAITSQLETLPPRMALRIAKAMDKENQITVGQVQSEELTGPRPQKLGVVTNRLRSSMRATKATIAGNRIDSAIGSNVKYAGALHDGFKGTVTVKSFTRHNPRGDRSTSEGGTVSLVSGRIRKTKFKQTASGIAVVKAHSRKMDIKGRHYITGPLGRATLAYGTAISGGIEAAWNEGGSPS